MMTRQRRLIALLCVLLPIALWALSGWSQLPARIDFPAGTTGATGATAPHDPDPTIQGIIDQVTQDEFNDLDSGLSGEHLITIGGQETSLSTRYTPSSQGVLAGPSDDALLCR